MDNRERDKFYSPVPEDTGENDEYELEPPDPDVLEGELRRARETIESTRTSVDFDEIYREAEHDRSQEILENWVRNFRFQFQTKHLLGATAVLAILLTLYKLELLGVALVFSIMFSLAGLYLYLQWQDKRHQEDVARRRREFYARRRAHMGKSSPATSSPPGEVELPARPASPTPAVSAIDEAWQAARRERDFQFRFSMWQLMAAMTAAALLFGLVSLLGGPSNAATLLGLVALFGLVVHALGYEPPEMVVLGWWLILVFYVGLSIVGAVWSGMT